MGKVPAPAIQWRGAHPNNFTVGRPGASRDGRNSFHHVVGSAESAVVVFNQPSRGASSHLVITDRTDIQAFQCVDFNNTAYCDGNWESNLRTISMEHHGDWRNGYNNPRVLENSAWVVAWLRENYGVTRAIRHRDVSLTGTICPADLPVEAIWNRSTEIIAQWNKPAEQPQWLKNRKGITEQTVYAQKEGFFIRNLNNPSQAADSRRFVLNQNFLVSGITTVDGQEYYITKSSMDLNLANGLLKSEVSTAPYSPPVVEPPKPTTPDWADSLLVDDANRTLYVLRATPLIDLENGRPVKDSTGKDIWYQAGDIIDNVSAHTIVAEVTYQLTEYSFQQIKGGKYQNANGIKASDLTTDPKATPPGTPANPEVPEDPTDPVDPMPDVPSKDDEQDARLTLIEFFITKLKELLAKIGINL